ncbi:hypothetical protein CTAYLR_010532 [Chrysophaeum taylorii]|uniref:High light inducible protein n=1 Tax=Chrysophaeum taylorii TaxID=2483200 RepID=A0AAD7XRJ1_9STRA|nr:hypothetical protein CTAYLR_010532 [Chrysophaeum taylorii]
MMSVVLLTMVFGRASGFVPATKAQPSRLCAYEDPGKAVLDEATFAQQSRDLDKLAEAWRERRLLVEWEQSKNVGFVEVAEIVNGRAAMFFVVTGLLTEYWTGQSFPEQVLTLLRTTGVIGLA